MFDIYFDRAFDDLYNRWVLCEIAEFKESIAFFERLNKRSTVKDFMKFFNKIKSDSALQQKFDVLYNKECVKSFILYLYENAPGIKENRREREKEGQKDYDLVWLCHFFGKLIEDYRFDIEGYKRDKIKDIKYHLVSLENRKNQTNPCIIFTNDEIEEFKKQRIEELDEVANIKKVEFFINGKYSNKELLDILLSDKGYYSPISCDFRVFPLDFYDIYNYPLKDYLLFMEYLKNVSFIYGKKHLKEYYDNDGSEKVKKKYKKQYDTIWGLCWGIRKIYRMDNTEFVFHDINLAEMLGTEDKLNSNDYFDKGWWMASAAIAGVGCIYSDILNNPYRSLFSDERRRVEKILERKRKEEHRKEVQKNPQFYVDFLTENKMMMVSSSFACVLNDNVDWDALYERYRKEAEEEVAKILRGE